MAAELSVTWAVKFEVPVADGVPEIIPVEVSIVSPGGNEPEVIDQE